MSEALLHIDRVRAFANQGKVYRAFNHLIAARMGTLLMVPMQLIAGRCDDVIDGCPVPWEEVHAVLEYPVSSPRPKRNWPWYQDHVQQLKSLGLDPAACELDFISPMVKGEEKVLRVKHPCGVRYAVVINY